MKIIKWTFIAASPSTTLKTEGILIVEVAANLSKTIQFKIVCTREDIDAKFIELCNFCNKWSIEKDDA